MGTSQPIAELRELSANQRRIWFLQQLAAQPEAYNVVRAYLLRGHLDVAHLQRALADALARHAWLRSDVVEVEGRPQLRLRESGEPRVPVHAAGSEQPSDEQALRRLVRRYALRRFDLTQAPLLRLDLVRLDAGDTAAILSAHRLVCDAWSLDRLWEELSGDSAVARPAVPPPSDEGVGEWWRRLEDLAALELPFAKPRPAVRSFDAAEVCREVPSDLVATVSRAAARLGVDETAVYLAALSALLFRYTGGDDIAIGLGLPDAVDRDQLIRCDGNTLVLRGHPQSSLAFEDLVRACDAELRQARAWAHVPVADVIERLRPDRDPSYNALWQIAYSEDELQPPRVVAGAEVVAELDVPPCGIECDLALRLVKRPARRMVSAAFSTAILTAADVERMLGHYLVLLASAVRDATQPLARLELLTAEERETLLVEWNRTERPWPRQACVHELFEEQAALRPDHLAVVHRGREVSYGEMDRRADRLALRLVELGVEPETTVGILADRSVETLVAILATMKAGGAYVPLDPEYPRQRLRFMLRDARCRLVLAREQLRHHLDGLDTTAVPVDESDAVPPPVANRPRGRARPDHLVYVIYTSGSTGVPKGVMIEHRSVVNLVTDSAAHYTAADRHQQFASLSFDMAVGEVFGTWAAGATLVLPDVPLASPREILELAALRRSTSLGLPTAFWRAVATDRSLHLPESVRIVGFGGERVEWHDVAAWEERTGVPWSNNYGPTETCVASLVYRRELGGPPLPVVPIGRPISNTRVYILDADANPLPVGVWGEICIAGVGVARGYLDRPDLTAERFVANPFATGADDARMYRTGDVGRWLPDGNVEFGGRVDDQIKIRGFRVELGEVEETLAGHPTVREAVATVRTTPAGDRQLVAYVTSNPGPTISGEDLRSWLATLLPGYMVPAAVVTVPAFPLTPNGKIDRSALPDPAEQRESMHSGVAEIAGEDELAMVLCELFASVLGLTGVDADDDFFDLGGDSLMGIKLLTYVEERLAIELPLGAIFETSTPRTMAAAVRELVAEAQPAGSP